MLSNWLLLTLESVLALKWGTNACFAKERAVCGKGHYRADAGSQGVPQLLNLKAWVWNEWWQQPPPGHRGTWADTSGSFAVCPVLEETLGGR